MWEKSIVRDFIHSLFLSRKSHLVFKPTVRQSLVALQRCSGKKGPGGTARAGAIAPCDVVVPAQKTGLGPEKSSFFQALGIVTKISRGSIEILSDVSLIKTGDKVGASEATLLNMLNISPFSYGLVIKQVYDNGSVHSPEMLDLIEKSLHTRFIKDVRNIARVCLKIGYGTVAFVLHTIFNGYKRVLAVAMETY